MENNKLENLKAIIDNRIKELSKRSFDKNIDFDGDECDEVQGNFLMNMVYEFSSSTNAEIDALYLAKNKMENAEYGLCEECGEEISFKRLAICPSAKYCIRCAEQIERESKLYRYGRTG